MMASMILIRFLFALFSALISGADIKTLAVPRMAFIIAFPFFIILKALLYKEDLLLESVSGVLAGLIVFLLAWFFSGKRLGLADVWFSSLIGLVLGPWWWYAAIGLSCVAGAIYIMAVKGRQIPFIPCMAFGSIVISILEGFLR